MMKPFVGVASTLFLLSACQGPVSAPVSSAPASPAPLAATLTAPSRPAASVVAYRSPVLAPVKPEVTGDIAIVNDRVSVRVKLPPRAVPTGADFRTQALYLEPATEISASLSDSYGRSYLPAGADGNGRVAYPANGELVLSFADVLPDALIFLELQVRDASAVIPQASLASVIAHTGVSDTSGVITFQTTPTAQAMKTLLGTNAARARAIPLADLATLMNTITGYAAGPPISYTTHPTLVNTALLASDLATQLPTELTAASYRQTGATVSLDVSGLVGSDTLDVQITDAASALATGLGNGNDQLITRATPGSGLAVRVGADSGNTTQYSFAVTASPVTLSNGATTDVTIVATPADVTLDSLTPDFGAIGQTLTLSGSGFSTEAANNTVAFDGVEADVTSASADELVVTVPPGISGSVDVTVQVGSSTSAPQSFEVVPTVSNVSPGTGSTGSVITLTGTGFSTTPANNTVRFGTVAGTVTAASTTSLTVTVTEAPAGEADATVQVGNRTSTAVSFDRLPVLTSVVAPETDGGLPALVRGLTLTLTGSNFDSVLANNQVRFTLADGTTVVSATPVTASATELTVVVPAGVNQPGSVGVVVRTNAQDSTSRAATVPTVAIDFDGGFE
ncbi:MAG: IPT/TIG domain-containing protein [Candidatus Sericytochromatia bacterium]